MKPRLLEVKPGADGIYDAPPDPLKAGPPLQGDRGRKRVERLCMRARLLEVVSDGTLAGTQLTVMGEDGIPRTLGGLIRFEMIVQRGYPKVSALIEQTYVHEEMQEYGENAGKTVVNGDKPDTLTIDIFERS